VTRDRLLGVILLLVAGAYYRAAGAVQTSDLADAVGPAGLPRAYAIVLATLALVLLVRSPRGAKGPTVSARTLRRVTGLLAIGVAYVGLVPWLGYPLALAGLLIGTTFYQGGRFNRAVIAVGIVGAAVLWIVFVRVLGVAQPNGAWLEPFLGAS
jgi:putative tricarboxylic transport membrane protein